MLSLRSVNQFYGQNHILWDVDLDLSPGTCTGILGRPGMGKTTLVNCIMGRLPINSGSISWKEDGSPPEDLLLQPAEQRAQMGIGYVPQGRHISYARWGRRQVSGYRQPFIDGVVIKLFHAALRHIAAAVQQQEIVRHATDQRQALLQQQDGQPVVKIS